MSVSKHFQPRTKRDLTVGSVRKLMYEHILHDAPGIFFSFKNPEVTTDIPSTIVFSYYSIKKTPKIKTEHQFFVETTLIKTTFRSSRHSICHLEKRLEREIKGDGKC